MLRNKTLNVALLFVLVTGTLAVGLARSAPVAGQDDADAAAKIENAMSAAPSTVSANATILDNEFDADGKFVVLRAGTNGWFCFPDLPGTPGNDPACMDQTFLDWTYAFYAGEEPNVTVVRLEYMLQGGSEASNTDPFATEPAAGEAWMVSPPHIMVIMPGDLDQTVFSPEYHSGAPWIMYPGTPYEHIMMPVTEGVMGEVGAMAEATMDVEQTRAVIAPYVAALGALEDVSPYLADDVVLTLVEVDQQIQGREAVAGAIDELHHQTFDGRPEVVTLIIGEGKAAGEFVFVGTHTGEFAGIPATGRSVRVPYTVFYDLADGKITALRIQGFASGLVAQLTAAATPAAGTPTP